MKIIITEQQLEQLKETKLWDLLLSIGGNDIKKVYEENLSELLSRGSVMKNKIKVIKMNQSQCHSNSAMFWENYTSDNGIGSASIVTGWVLDNNSWYQHSWILIKNTIIETTYKRDVYFGYILNNDEAEIFVDNNY